jgi:hypothetical protein
MYYKTLFRKKCFQISKLNIKKRRQLKKAHMKIRQVLIIYEVTMAKPAVSRTGKPKKFIQLNWHSYGV